jgi:hypothetical protein
LGSTNWPNFWRLKCTVDAWRYPKNLEVDNQTINIRFPIVNRQPQNRILLSCQFLPKLSIRLLPIFTQIIHKYRTFWEKGKAAVYFNQHESVYVLLKLFFYGMFLWEYAILLWSALTRGSQSPENILKFNFQGPGPPFTALAENMTASYFGKNYLTVFPQKWDLCM